VFVLYLDVIDELQKSGEIAISQVPMLKRAKDIIDAIRRSKEAKPLVGELHSHNVWMYGEAGCGKTGWLTDYYTDNGGFIDKDKSKYWNEEPRPNVLIDDIEIEDKHMLGNLKRWAQHKPFKAEDKYGTFNTVRPNHIAVTSNYHPKEIWENPKELEPIMRRFTIVNFQGRYFPEGHPRYDPAHRADRLYPGQRVDNNNEIVEDPDVSAS